MEVNSVESSDILAIHPNKNVKTFPGMAGWLRRNLLLILTIASVLVGIGLGFILRSFHLTPHSVLLISFPGEMLMHMLKLMILPLIISSLISGKILWNVTFIFHDHVGVQQMLPMLLPRKKSRRGRKRLELLFNSKLELSNSSLRLFITQSSKPKTPSRQFRKQAEALGHGSNVRTFTNNRHSLARLSMPTSSEVCLKNKLTQFEFPV